MASLLPNYLDSLEEPAYPGKKSGSRLSATTRVGWARRRK